MSIQSVKECSASCQMTEDQRQRLLDTFSRIKTSPYENPERFLLEALDRSDKVEFFKDAILEFMIEGTLDCVPALYIKGLPVEYDIPVLDQHDPLKDKYVRKKTFVTEAILAVAAYYTNTEIVAFSTINNGDLFHDIYMKESLKHTASQKSMVSFGFHYDMGFKSDRPDWANLACLRSSDVNRISTSLCRNIDLIENMSAEDLNILAQPIFTTPEEVVSLKPGEPVPEPPQIAVYYPKEPWKFKFFEGRTVSRQPDAQAALNRLCALCHRFKMELVLAPGDLAMISNNHCAHCREVIQVVDLEAHKKRWLIKTYNRNISGQSPNPGQFYLSPK